MTVRQPPPGKGYDLQSDYTEGVEEFWFRWEDQWWSMPHGKMLDFKKLLQVATLRDQFSEVTSLSIDEATEALNEVFTMLMGADQAAEFAKVNRPVNALMETLTQWQAHSGLTEEKQGESSASDDSSRSTGRPSKRTSSGSTASGSRKRSSAPRKTVTPRGNSSSASAG